MVHLLAHFIAHFPDAVIILAVKLHLVFSKGTGSKTITISDPNPNLNKAQAYEAMQAIVDKKAVLVKDVPVDGIKKTYYSDVIVTELEDDAAGAMRLG